MNKKGQIKQQKLQDKKLKDQRRQELLKALSTNKLSSEDMEKLNSIRDATSSKQIHKIKKPLPIEEQIEEQIEEEQVEEQQIPEQRPIINIFQTQNYQAENPIQIQQPQFKAKISESERLEIEAKRLFPELTFDTFGDKIKQIVEEESVTNIQLDDIYDLDETLMINYDELLQNNIEQFKSKSINRPQEISSQRQQLPILLQENEIIDSVVGNLITLVSGETGCGKSTQIPQFLYEKGFTDFGQIAITQPRRLAAISLAQRVSEETGFKLGEQISYQVKHQSSGVSEKTQMKVLSFVQYFSKFMTDGILLNEMQTNVLLPQYSVIIIDEAHERKVNIDILIGVLSRVVLARAKMNNKLRLIIMSATLRLDDFITNKQVFPRQINLIKIQTRQYPVKTYFSKITKDNYVEAAVEKCLKIHQALPAGDILVFLTGQKEIQLCCKMLRNKLEQLEEQRINQEKELSNDEQEEPNQESEFIEEEGQQQQEDVEQDENVYQKNDYVQLKNLIGKQTNQSQQQFTTDQQLTKFSVFPLFSKLDIEKQQKIFKNTPSTCRMIVVATNVAETSITIPTIRYVVDAGKQKRKLVDQKIGLERHIIDWISQAAADQRSGRAGRTGPGYCYRLYSTAVYANRFRKYEEPEITEMPLDHVILQMKSIGIKDVHKFPYLSRPNLEVLKKSIKDLVDLGCLKRKQQIASEDNTVINDLGRVLSQIPIMPKYGKMLLQSRSSGVFHYGIILVCILSVEELINKSSFQQQQQEDDNQEDSDDNDVKQYEKLKAKKQQQYYQESKSICSYLQSYGDNQKISDLINIMNIIGLFMNEINDEINIEEQIIKFAQTHKLITKQLKEIYYNIIQILEIFNIIVNNQQEIQQTINQLKQYIKPNIDQQQILGSILIQANGLKKIAKLQETIDANTNVRRFYYATKEMEEVFIHPTSIFYGKQRPEFLSYTSLIGFTEQKYCMMNLTIVNDLTLLYEMDHQTPQQKKLAINQNSEYYDSQKDQIMCSGQAQIDNQWTVNNIKVPYQTDIFGFYSKFAQLLLKGDIYQDFIAYSKYYKYQLKDIKESNMQPYSQQIIKCFMINEIKNKATLNAKWLKQKQFFLNEFLLLVQSEYHEVVKKNWPPK